jgi:hypothetical protein
MNDTVLYHAGVGGAGAVEWNITLDLGRNIFAYRHGDDLWTHDGCHLGRFDPCTVRGCGARATKLARYADRQGRPLRQREHQNDISSRNSSR